MNALLWVILLVAAIGGLLFVGWCFWRSLRLAIGDARLRRLLNDAREVSRIRRGWR